MPFRWYGSSSTNWADWNEEEDATTPEFETYILHFTREKIRYNLELRLLKYLPKVVCQLLKWKNRATHNLTMKRYTLKIWTRKTLAKLKTRKQFKVVWYQAKIRVRLIHYVRMCRSRRYIRHMAVCCIHYWMETNCAKHLHNNVLFMIQNHIRTVSKGKLPRTVHHVLTKMRELTDRPTPLLKGVAGVHPSVFTGHMMKHLSRFKKDVDEFRSLKLDKKIVKFYKGSNGIGGIIDLLETSLERKLLIWRIAVEKTLRICKQVSLPYKETPDYLFLFTIASVLPPDDQNHDVYRSWSELSGFSVDMGLDKDVIITFRGTTTN